MQTKDSLDEIREVALEKIKAGDYRVSYVEYSDEHDLVFRVTVRKEKEMETPLEG
jgi:hypothetical protein